VLAKEAQMRITGIVAAGLLFAAGAGFGGTQARAAEAPWGADVSEPVNLLGSLHRAAMHQVQLGDLAQANGDAPEVREFGAQLASDFRAVDQRITALAGGLGVDSSKLQVSRTPNVPVLKQDADNFSRLASQHGPSFDRDFLVTVADAQARESDLLVTAAAHEPALTDLAQEMGRVYDRSSRRALEAARVAKNEAAQPPTETPPQATPSDSAPAGTAP
jgi:predicted outer membrane protein